MQQNIKQEKFRKIICIISIVIIFLVSIVVFISIYFTSQSNFIGNEVMITKQSNFFNNILTKDKSQNVSNTLNSKRKEKIKSFDFSTWNQNPENINLMILNKNNGIPENYPVDIDTQQGFIFNKTGVDMFIKMITDGREQGVDFVINSSYRSVENQQDIFNNDIDKYISQGFSKEIAFEKTAAFIQKPGYSEHNFGICADIVSQEYPHVEQGFEKTKAFKWLDENAHNYGFILRYPQKKQDITLISYEPWHYRYVGVENAKKIKQNGVCLEEYVYDIINKK